MKNKKWYLIVDGSSCNVTTDKSEYETLNVVILPLKPNEAATIFANIIKAQQS